VAGGQKKSQIGIYGERVRCSHARSLATVSGCIGRLSRVFHCPCPAVENAAATPKDHGGKSREETPKGRQSPSLDGLGQP
jgi:hypothetical protein